MASRALVNAWLVVLVAGPVIGLFLGPRLRQRLSRRVILLSVLGVLSVMALALTPVSLPGVLADHVVLAGSYVWSWMCLGMFRSRLLRAALFGLLPLYAVWGMSPGSIFFLTIAAAEITALPERTIALDCGWSTRVVRTRLYGWVAHSGYEVSVHSRPWGLPLEIERDRRRFDDALYDAGDQFSARVVGNGDCTTIIAYNGVEEWRAR